MPALALLLDLPNADRHLGRAQVCDRNGLENRFTVRHPACSLITSPEMCAFRTRLVVDGRLGAQPRGEASYWALFLDSCAFCWSSFSSSALRGTSFTVSLSILPLNRNGGL